MRSYRDNIIRILSAYPLGSEGLLKGLEAICHTAEQNGSMDGRDLVAQNVCEGLHASPAQGIKCRKCYETEAGFVATEGVMADIELSKKRIDET